MLHLHEGTAKLYSGDYTSFERQRSEQLRQQQIAFDKEQVERAHLQSFIDRFKASAAKAKQAQSRVKRLAKLAGTEAVRAEREIRINFADPIKLPNSLTRLNKVDAGYGDIKILSKVGFGLEAGDRIGLLGPNGAGKSTLVKTLVGELPILAGERSAHPDMELGYFAQHYGRVLHEGQSPIDHCATSRPAPVSRIPRLLGRWNFAGNRAFENVDGFSGGERARLALALIAWRKPNVLLLDEPTNHLDLEMREALAEALSIFPGAIVMVSHDRHLIGLVCETFWRVADGKVEDSGRYGRVSSLVEIAGVEGVRSRDWGFGICWSRNFGLIAALTPETEEVDPLLRHGEGVRFRLLMKIGWFAFPNPQSPTPNSGCHVYPLLLSRRGQHGRASGVA